MPAATYDILIEQGSVFTLDLVYKDGNGIPINLTNYEARMQVRQKYASPDPAALSLSTSDNSITLGGALGTIHIEATSELTAALTIRKGVYDLELVPPQGEDKAFRLIEGAVTISPEVTRG